MQSNPLTHQHGLLPAQCTAICNKVHLQQSAVTLPADSAIPAHVLRHEEFRVTWHEVIMSLQILPKIQQLPSPPLNEGAFLAPPFSFTG